VQCDQHVDRLDVAVNDSLLVGMLHRLTYVDEQFKAFVNGQVVLVAVVGYGQAADEFHDEIGSDFSPASLAGVILITGYSSGGPSACPGVGNARRVSWYNAAHE
jgi:crotonobetainyl-CoA:carnitine CoA-transferase CaiB-like acyl-CoA transferase